MEYNKIAQKNRVVTPLSSSEFESVRNVFWHFARDKGFYLTISEALENNGYFVFSFQKQIAEILLESAFRQQKTRLNISLFRQIGKTEFVALVMGFLFDHYHKAFNCPIKICIVAPEKDTAGVVFQRITKYIDTRRLQKGGDTKKLKKSERGDEVELFGIYDDNKGGTIEGRTYDFIIRDEAHMGSDRMMADQVEPTTLTTNGAIVFIGNGGYKDCIFRRNLVRGEDLDPVTKVRNVSIVHNYPSTKPYLQELANRGLGNCQTRINNIEDYINTHGGWDSYEVRKNMGCEWILTFGNYVTKEQLANCHSSEIRWERGSGKTLYMAVDFAKSYDRTIATIINKNREIVDWIILKEADEQMKIRWQCEELRNYCDMKGYTQHLAMIAGDATGLGSGAIEFMEMEFSFSEIVPYSFSERGKHDWFVKGREMITTKFDPDRIKYNPAHPHAAIFEKEMTELEVLPATGSKKYIGFSAPNMPGCYDDFVCSFAMAVDLLTKDTGTFGELNSFVQRNNSWDKDEMDEEDEELKMSSRARHLSRFVAA